MITHIWSVLCRKTVIDNDTNNMSLIDVFEQLGLNDEKGNLEQGKPFDIPFEFEIISMLKKNKKEAHVDVEVKVDLCDPSAKMLKTFSNKFEIPQEIRRMRSRLRIN